MRDAVLRQLDTHLEPELQILNRLSRCQSRYTG